YNSVFQHPGEWQIVPADDGRAAASSSRFVNPEAVADPAGGGGPGGSPPPGGPGGGPPPPPAPTGGGRPQARGRTGRPPEVRVAGVLLLHEDPLVQDATTVREHVGAFGRHSRFAWYPFNVAFGLPPALARYEFAVCVFHYSLRPTYHWLTNLLREYLLACPGT